MVRVSDILVMVVPIAMAFFIIDIVGGDLGILLNATAPLDASEEYSVSFEQQGKILNELKYYCLDKKYVVPNPVTLERDNSITCFLFSGNRLLRNVKVTYINGEIYERTIRK